VKLEEFTQGCQLLNRSRVTHAQSLLPLAAESLLTSTLTKLLTKALKKSSKLLAEWFGAPVGSMLSF
jgi:hypothetical protein